MGFGNKKYLVECVGTFFLTLVYGLSGDAFAIGFTLSAFIYLGALSSGAHFNPAISTAAFFLKKLSPAQFFNYLLAQLAGAFMAASTILLISDLVFYVEAPLNSGFYQQLGVEAIFSAVLVLVALAAWVGNSSHKSIPTYSFIMGFTLVAAVTTAENISGGIFNPAISIGTSILDYFVGGASYLDIPIYTIGPVAGSALAVIGYKTIIQDSD